MTDSGKDGDDIREAATPPSVEDAPRSRSRTVQAEAALYEYNGQDWEFRQKELGLGWLGKFCGSRASAPTNAASFVVVVAVIALVLSVFFTGEGVVELRKILATLVSSALSFLFGSATRK